MVKPVYLIADSGNNMADKFFFLSVSSNFRITLIRVDGPLK